MLKKTPVQEHRSVRKETVTVIRTDAAKFAADLARHQGYELALRITDTYAADMIGEGTIPNPHKAFYKNAHGYLKNRKASDFAFARNKKRLAK